MRNKWVFLFLELLLVGGIICLLKINYPKSNKAYLEENYCSKEELEESFDKNGVSKIDKIEAIITSHHFLARDLIAKGFSKIDGKKIERVIIISPDHFKQIEKKETLAITASIDWKTYFGEVNPDSEGIKRLEKSRQVEDNTTPFEVEHGIFTLIPFIKNYLPKAKVIPIILKTKSDYIDFYDLGKKTASYFNRKKTLLVISSDFSHYIPSEEAKQNDLESVEILKTKDKDKINLIKNDCPECVAFLFGYLDENSEFNLIENTNSFEISGKDENYVTSYISAFYK